MKYPTPAEQNEIVKRYLKGIDISELETQFGYNSRLIQRVLKENNIKLVESQQYKPTKSNKTDTGEGKQPNKKTNRLYNGYYSKGERWTKEHDVRLRELVKLNVPSYEIAWKLGRSQRAIELRIKRRGLR